MLQAKYSAVSLKRGQFFHKYSQKALHSLPVRARNGVSFVVLASGWYSVSVPVIIYVKYYNNGPRYNGTWLYQVKLDELKEELDGCRWEPVMKFPMSSTRANRCQWFQSTPELNLRKAMELFHPPILMAAMWVIHCKLTPLRTFY